MFYLKLSTIYCGNHKNIYIIQLDILRIIVITLIKISYSENKFIIDMIILHHPS